MASGSGPSTGCCCRRCWADWVPTASAVPASLPLHRRASRQGQRWLRVCGSPQSARMCIVDAVTASARLRRVGGSIATDGPHAPPSSPRSPSPHPPSSWPPPPSPPLPPMGRPIAHRAKPSAAHGWARTTPDSGQRCILGLWTVSCGPTSHVHVQPGRCTHEMNDCHERDQRPDRGRSTEVLVHCWLVLTSVLLLKFLTRSGPAPSCGALSLVLHDPRDLRSVSSLGREIARERNGVHPARSSGVR